MVVYRQFYSQIIFLSILITSQLLSLSQYQLLDILGHLLLPYCNPFSTLQQERSSLNTI